jgi:hypothetical protein
MSSVLKSFKLALFSFSPSKCLVESFIRFDFKLGDSKENLMQACFASLAVWPMFVLLAVIAYDPFKADWSLVHFLAPDNSFLLFLLDGRLQTMFVFFGVTFVLEWIFRREYLILFILAYLVGRFELHINLAVAAMLGIILSRISYHWWAMLDLTSDSRKIWARLHQTQMLAWVVAVAAALLTLDYLQINHIFQKQGLLTRLNFFAMVYACYNGLNLMASMIWGHFYFHAKKDPTTLSTYYSSAQFILRFRLGEQMVYQMKKLVKEQIQKHTQHSQEYENLKKESPGLANFPFSKVVQLELSYLREALLRLDKI